MFYGRFSRILITKDATMKKKLQRWGNILVLPSKPLPWELGPLFQKGLLSLNRVLQNKKRIKLVDLKIWFCSFLVHDSSRAATELAKQRPQFL